MSSLFLSSPLLPLTVPLHHRASCHRLQPRYTCCYLHTSISHCLSSSILHHSLSHRQPSINAVTPSNEGAISVINFEDFVEKDWSIFETNNTNTGEANKKMTDRIISAGEIKGTSKVLVSIGSEGFVDQMVDSSPCQQLLVVRDSLLTLACIKEKYDKVNCWQGELIYLPEKWSSFDVVFLYFLPALPFELNQVFESLAKRFLPGSTGARLVISLPEGREVLVQQWQQHQHQHPDVIVSNLPDKMTLENAAAEHSFETTEFVYEPGFYLAVLRQKIDMNKTVSYEKSGDCYKGRVYIGNNFIFKSCELDSKLATCFASCLINSFACTRK